MNAHLAYELTREILATADVFLRESQRLFKPHGMTPAQFNVLNILADVPDGLSQRELSDKLLVDRSNVTGLLDRLEKLGWVRRSDDPRDRRVYRVTLTESGRRQWAAVHPQYLAVAQQVTACLSATEAKQLLQTLGTLQKRATDWSLPD